MGSAVLTNAVATRVKENSPTTNYNSDTVLGVRDWPNMDGNGYIWWSRPFPLGATILNAEIVFYTKAWAESGTRGFRFTRLNVSFSASKMTYNNRPTSFISGDKDVTKVGAQPANQEWRVNVTDWMQTISNGGFWGGLRIIPTQQEAILRYIHSENAANPALRPRLEVTWSDAPAQPTGLSPSGGRAVSVAAPIVRAIFRDVSGSVTLAGVQVQANATDVWTAPSFDSGDKATSVPELDLSGTFPRTASITTTNTSTTITAASATFEQADVGAAISGTGIQGGTTITAVASGTSATISLAANASGTNSLTITRSFSLADGGTRFWRIRFKDAAGVWSAWSAATSFTRDIKGTLVLDNPPVGTPIVEDTTPPIAWTFTVETQAAYQVQIKHTVNGVEVVDWDTGKISSTDDTITVPPGKINEPTNTTYTVTVRIWDTKSREATPNDPTYVEVVRQFTFVPGATTGTTALNAVPDTIRPKIVLTWTAATFPDRFNILRNGKVIAAALDPDDTFVSGTTHTYTDESPSPGRTLVYQVQRVVNDVASATNSTDTVTPAEFPIRPAIWLREPVSGLELPIFNAEAPDWTLGESVGVMQAIAPSAPKVLINQTLGGLEGRVAGTLIEAYGQTAQYWRDQFLKMRALRVKKFWLTSGELTFQVVAQEFTYRQPATKEVVFDVGFTVYQQNSVDTLLTGA